MMIRRIIAPFPHQRLLESYKIVYQCGLVAYTCDVYSVTVIPDRRVEISSF